MNLFKKFLLLINALFLVFLMVKGVFNNQQGVKAGPLTEPETRVYSDNVLTAQWFE